MRKHLPILLSVGLCWVVADAIATECDISVFSEDLELESSDGADALRDRLESITMLQMTESPPSGTVTLCLWVGTADVEGHRRLCSEVDLEETQ